MIRSHDKDDNVHMRIPVKIKMAVRMKILVLQVYFHKYSWNMMHLCLIEDFKIKIVDLNTHKQQATRHHSEYKFRF